MSGWPRTFHPDPEAPPYRVDQGSPYRVKADFRVDFTNGSHVEAKDFLLDIEGEDVTPERLAEIIDLFEAGKGDTVQPGPQNGRFYSAPASGLTTLQDEKAVLKSTRDGKKPV